MNSGTCKYNESPIFSSVSSVKGVPEELRLCHTPIGFGFASKRYEIMAVTRRWLLALSAVLHAILPAPSHTTTPLSGSCYRDTDCQFYNRDSSGLLTGEVVGSCEERSESLSMCKCLPAYFGKNCEFSKSPVLLCFVLTCDVCAQSDAQWPSKLPVSCVTGSREREPITMDLLKVYTWAVSGTPTTRCWK